MREPVSSSDIAEVWESLGDVRRANLMWERSRKETEETATQASRELEGCNAYLDRIEATVEAVPPSRLLRHDKTCWRRHAWCLAERIRYEID